MQDPAVRSETTPIYTVSGITREIKELLGGRFSEVRVQGEISNFTAHGSGHWYFSVKDAHAVLNCVMFRRTNQRLKWRPAPGDQVVMSGSIDVYAPQGRYNLIVRGMTRAGDGDLLQRIEALKRKLAAEGLTDPARKRPLPRYPRAIGVATSPTGAAIRDILRVIGRRFPAVTIYLAPCRVQGEGAAEEVARAIRLLVRHGRSDVLIVGRGGGSREDLMCFNEEVVARAIAASTIPVVSAVGHEIDVSISDLVADVRAATPSHAGELVVPDRESLGRSLAEVDQRLRAAMARELRRRRERLNTLVLRDPRRRIADGRLRVDELFDRLVFAIRRLVARRRERLGHFVPRHPRQRIVQARRRCHDLCRRLHRSGERMIATRRERLARIALPDPRRDLAWRRERVSHLDQGLRRAMERDLAKRRERVAAAAGRMDALGPTRVLERGYSVVFGPDGKVVRDSASLAGGDELCLRFHRGTARACVASTDAD